MKEVDYLRGRLGFEEEGEDNLFELIFGGGFGVVRQRLQEDWRTSIRTGTCLMSGTPQFGRRWTATARDTTLPIALKDEFTMRLAHDDDKHWYNETKKLADRPLGEETKLKRARHVRDNAKGFVADVTVNAASGFPVNVRYRRSGE
ncbi:hypothetical protein THAOC_26114, partial [Thalassiosira oceanica]